MWLAILYYLQVPSIITHLMLTTLLQFSSEWPLLSEKFQHATFTILQNILQLTPLDCLTSIFVKCILIQLITSSQCPMDSKLKLSDEEVVSILDASNSNPPVLTAVAVLRLLKGLILFEENKHILLEQGIFDLLTPLTESDGTQNYAAELICSLLSPSSVAEDPTESHGLSSTFILLSLQDTENILSEMNVLQG